HLCRLLHRRRNAALVFTRHEIRHSYRDDHRLLGLLFNNWQASGRVDHTFSSRHSMGGRYLFSDSEQGGIGQVTPPGLTTQDLLRTQATSIFFTSSLTPRVLNELRISWQRAANASSATDRTSETIPSIEVPELGLTG